YPLILSFPRYPPHPPLHPFPTRRSSDLRIIRTPRCPAPTGRIAIASSLNLSWFKQSGKPLAARLHSPDMIRICAKGLPSGHFERSEEHTSELQSQSNLVCRLLLEKKKK